MSVIFALIVLLLITAVIVVMLRAPASPGDESEPEPPSSADLLPTPMTVEELQRVQLPIAVRGYRMADVDALLERIRTEWQPKAPPHGISPPPLPTVQPQGNPVIPSEQSSPPADLTDHRPATERSSDT